MAPEFLECIGYENTWDATGSSTSSYRYVCDFASWTEVRELLMYSVDGLDGTLSVYKVGPNRYYNNNWGPVAELTAVTCPTWKLDLLRPNLPWRVRYRDEGQFVTVAGKNALGTLCTWTSDGKKFVNLDILPRQRIIQVAIEVYGSRSSVDRSYFAAIENCVNDEIFLGAPIGCILVQGADIEPRQLVDGTFTNDVKLHLLAQNIPWNNDWRQDTQAWDGLLVNGNDRYAAVDIATALGDFA